jgi:signal recognition particle subunit SRP54
MSFWGKLTGGLSRTKDRIGASLSNMVAGKIDENTLDELEEILITSDVGINTSTHLIARMNGRRGEAKDAADLPAILREEMLNILNVGPVFTLADDIKPQVIMVVGVNGVGKTTSIAKLANLFKSQEKSVILGAGDTFRAAASEQLVKWGERVGCPVVRQKSGADPSAVAFEAVDRAVEEGFDLLLLDTAGRLQIDEGMMDELVRLKKAVKPHEILLVLDAMTGQDAVNAAVGFNEALGIDGIIMTKLDGDARGGAALSAKSVTQRPIKFIGVGEKLDALEAFHPERMASRILGMGDMLSLIEKAQENFDDAQAEELERKMKKNEFTLEDFLEQMGQIKKMGGLAKLMDMLPGMGGRAASVNIENGEREFRQMEAIIQSMTKAERRDPSVLNASRRKRIAAGSGQPVTKINSLVKRYEEARKMMKQFMTGPKHARNKLFRGLS